MDRGHILFDVNFSVLLVLWPQSMSSLSGLKTTGSGSVNIGEAKLVLAVLPPMSLLPVLLVGSVGVSVIYTASRGSAVLQLPILCT